MSVSGPHSAAFVAATTRGSSTNAPHRADASKWNAAMSTPA
jgi:hypothetical protein